MRQGDTNSTNNISTIKWAKRSALDDRNKLHNTHYFIESGLGPENFNKDGWTSCVNFATKKLDPAGRPNRQTVINRGGKGEEMFPVAGDTVVLDGTFLETFGFPSGSKLKCTMNAGGGYEYIISDPYSGIIMTNISIYADTRTNHSQDADIRKNEQLEDWRGTNQYPLEDLFIKGNAIKNGIILDKYYFYGNNYASPEEKKALLFIKELGDVLQVLIMLMHLAAVHPGLKKYAMSTCDEVVLY